MGALRAAAAEDRSLGTLAERAAAMREALGRSRANTDAMVAILGSFDHRLSALDAAMRPTQVKMDSIRRAHENIDKTLKSADVILKQFDLSRQAEAKILKGPHENLEGYLEAVDQLRSNVQFFSSNKSFKSSDGFVNLANGLLEKAIHKLEEEFRQLLNSHSKPIEPDRLFDCLPNNSHQSSGFPGHDNDKDNLPDVNQAKSLENAVYIPPTLIPQRIVPLLHDLVVQMVQAGHRQQLQNIYREIRASVLEQSLRKLGVERLSKDDVQKMQWEALEAKIGNWIHYMRIAVKLLFAAEKKLSDQIFEGIEFGEIIFSEVTSNSMAMLLSFGEAIAKSKRSLAVFGYARSKMTDEELRHMISKTLTCRIDKRENCGDKMEQFLQRCFYHSGQYSPEDNFSELNEKLKEKEVGRVSNRLFYLSIPPNIFVDVVRCASSQASSSSGWTRVIVEKPFGRDSESSGELTRCLKQYLTEEQIFRIDHYLGKELVENLSVLRFSNLVFEPLWCRQYIRNVQLIFSEDFGTEGRGGYFDNYGIIRDIMQNHLLQILALFAMETPVSLNAEDIRNEKVKVLRSMRQLQIDDLTTGQYKGHTKGGKTCPGYTDDPTVPKDSLTPTFAAVALFIDNARWDGVPFLMKAGKALHTRRTEIRVQFRHVPGNLYKRNFGTDMDKATNELVIRVQPDEAIYLKINNKLPGLGMRLDRSNLNLLYSARYPIEIPDAYETLLLDAMAGERRLFIRSDELDAAWALFSPLLKELEENKIAPELYPYGSRGPVGAHYLAAKHNVRWGDLGDDGSS